MFSIPGIESLPLAVQFAVLFVVIFAVFALIILVLRRLMGGRVAMQSADRERTRTRQPRLGIVDVYDLDRQRQLVLLRRDNVEHLLLIGGPNDVVIETNIVRSSAARANPGVDNGDRSDSERAVEPAVSRPVLETSSWAPSAPVAQIAPAEAAGAMPAAVSLPPAPAARPAGTEVQGGLQKTLSQYLRRPESAPARAPEPAPAARTPAPADKPARPTAQPKPSPVARPAAASPAPLPDATGQTTPAEAKLPFGMRAAARTAPPAPATAQMAPAPSPPPRSAPAAAPAPQREPAPPAPQPAETAPPGDISGDLRPAEPNLVDTALLSDMAKQLETALRRPLSQAAPQAAFEADPVAPALPAPDANTQPSAPAPQQAAASSGQQNWARPAPAPNRPAPPLGGFSPRPQSGAGDGGRPVTPPARNPGAFAPPLPAKPLDDEESNDFSRPLGQDEPRTDPAENRPPDHDRPPTARVQSYPAPLARDTAPSPIEAMVEEESLHFESAFAPAPAPPAAAPEPAPAPTKASQVDPFSMEDIEAEFARLLGRPLDKR